VKHLLVSIFFTAFSFCVQAQADNKIVIGTVDSIQSKILNEKRKIWIYVPPNDGTNEKFTKKRYPVVYLLDGDFLFLQTVSMIQQLHPAWGDPVCPEMIVVGIPNTDRMRDFTPTHVVYEPGDSTSGGGEKFISFIERELMPYVDSKYPTEPYKMLVGYSLGGLAVMQTFVHHTNLFNSYIAIDPSLWWDNHALIHEAQSIFRHKKFQGTSFFLGFSSVFNIEMDVKELSKDTLNTDYPLNLSILKLRDSLVSYRKNGLNFQRKNYKDDWHNTVGLIAEYDALRFIFKDYFFKLPDNDTTDAAIGLIDQYKLHYAKFGMEPPGISINDAGYSALSAKKYKTAEALFNYNLGRYPGSYKVYVAMGDYYSAIGDNPNAIINYKKSLDIEEIADTRKKLEKAQGK
jgi:uncharacterized protein